MQLPSSCTYEIIMPKAKDLQCVRGEIVSLFQQGDSYPAILQNVNELLRVRTGDTVSLRTLKTQLGLWGLTRNQDHILDDLYEEIGASFEAGTPIDQIHEDVNSLLVVRGHQHISVRTFKRQLHAWGLQRYIRSDFSDSLVELVRGYFYTFGYSDESIVRDLQRQHAIHATAYTIRQIRWRNGMKRRFRTIEEREAALRTAIDFLEHDLQRSTAIRSLGRGHLYNYVRSKGQVLISQNRLYDFYRTIFPKEVQRRREGNFKYRTDFQVPGPNFLWCLDGYEKLKRFGI
jgi:hypothetical protein